jgi:hypothetical protein
MTSENKKATQDPSAYPKEGRIESFGMEDQWEVELAVNAKVSMTGA